LPHISAPLQGLPSEQLAALVVWAQPAWAVQLSLVQALPSSQAGGVQLKFAVQVPPRHVPALLLQARPSLALAATQPHVLGLQVLVRHSPRPGQLTSAEAQPRGAAGIFFAHVTHDITTGCALGSTPIATPLPAHTPARRNACSAPSQTHARARHELLVARCFSRKSGRIPAEFMSVVLVHVRPGARALRRISAQGRRGISAGLSRNQAAD
jgi:hypothetical protein